MQYTLNDLKTEFRISNDGDSWGNAMQWLFAVAEEIHFARDFDVPHEWQYGPSPIGRDNDGTNYLIDIVANVPDEDLARFGDMLFRLTNILEAKGLSY